jgi:hypothetical protein
MRYSTNTAAHKQLQYFLTKNGAQNAKAKYVAKRTRCTSY